MGIVHTLVVEGKHDRAFLERYTAGWPLFERYLLGETDGQPKNAAWAAGLTGVAADEIVALARRLHSKRALIVV
jgi:biotin/methionine sulfoxide reductase